jgi:uncharacterized membrane protein YukC
MKTINKDDYIEELKLALDDAKSVIEGKDVVTHIQEDLIKTMEAQNKICADVCKQQEKIIKELWLGSSIAITVVVIVFAAIFFLLKPSL